jgi:hypothetical protein
MPVTINGSGSIVGLAVGGLPDGSVDADTLAANAVTAAKLSSTAISAAKLPVGSIVQVKTTESSSSVGSSGSNDPYASGLITTLTPHRASSKFFVTACGMSFHNNAGSSNQGTKFWLYASINGGSYSNVTSSHVQSCQRSGGSWTDFPGILTFTATVSYSLGQTVAFQIYYGRGANASGSSYFHHTGGSGNGAVYQQTVMEIAA